MKNISTDKAIECILYAVAHKSKMGLDIEDSVERAKSEIINIWEKDIDDIQNISSLIFSQ